MREAPRVQLRSMLLGNDSSGFALFCQVLAPTAWIVCKRNWRAQPVALETVRPVRPPAVHGFELGWTGFWSCWRLEQRGGMPSSGLHQSHTRATSPAGSSGSLAGNRSSRPTTRTGHTRQTLTWVLLSRCCSAHGCRRSFPSMWPRGSWVLLSEHS